MKLLRNLLKWMGIILGSILLLLAMAGISYRIFGPILQEPRGKMVDVGGFSLHIQSEGKRRGRPTLVVETGGGLAGEHYHWLYEGLKDSMRVVRYDRAGIGYSDSSPNPRDPETIAYELHTLLKNAGETPPYILAGHSIGGPYISVFAQLYPEEVEALVFLDNTHPDRVERMDLPTPSSFIFRSMVLGYEGLAVLGDLGLVGLYERLFGPIIPMEGLPEEVEQRAAEFLLDGKLIRTYAKELALYHSTLQRASQASDFGSLPLLIFGSGKEMSEGAKEHYRKRGIDPHERGMAEVKLKEDILSWSTDSKLMFIDGDHNSMYTLKANADLICDEILALLRRLPKE